MKQPNIPTWWANGTARGLEDEARFCDKMASIGEGSPASARYRGKAEAYRFLAEYIRKEGGLTDGTHIVVRRRTDAEEVAERKAV